MTSDDLFSAVLIALGPPDKIPHTSGKGSIRAGFAEKVDEYNRFITGSFGHMLQEHDYMAYSKWFHDRR